MANVKKSGNIEMIENSPANNQVIILKSVFSKENTVTVYPTKDRSGRYLGGVKMLKPDGSLILSREEEDSGEYFPSIKSFRKIKSGTEFDLSNEYDRKDWNWVKHSPRIAESFEAAQRSSTAEFYVWIPETESKKTVDKISLEYKALSFIMEDSMENHINICKLLGSSVSGLKPVEIKEYLLSIAKSNPNKIIAVYTDSDMKTKLFLIDAINRGIITRNRGVYMYQEEILGLDDNQAVEWLKNPKNKLIVEQISQELYPEYKKATK